MNGLGIALVGVFCGGALFILVCGALLDWFLSERHPHNQTTQPPQPQPTPPPQQEREPEREQEIHDLSARR